jgi:hypothetical protein
MSENISRSYIDSLVVSGDSLSYCLKLPEDSGEFNPNSCETERRDGHDYVVSPKGRLTSSVVVLDKHDGVMHGTKYGPAYIEEDPSGEKNLLDLALQQGN